LRAGLAFFRDGRRVSQTPLVEPSQVNEANHTASFRISVPLSTAGGAGRYTVQAIVVEAGGEQSGFARGFFALRTAATPSPVTSPAGN
jgi:hypothetical protein